MEIEYQGVMYEVDFEVEPGQQGITHLAPEDCQEGFDDVIVITSLTSGDDIRDLLTSAQMDDLAELIAKRLRSA